MKQVVLAGDYILDVEGFVSGEPCNREELQRSTRASWPADKIVVEGDRACGLASYSNLWCAGRGIARLLIFAKSGTLARPGLRRGYFHIGSPAQW